MFGIGLTSSPWPIATRRSTTNTDMPSDFFATSASGVVRASRIIRSECRTCDVHTFWPLHDIAVTPAPGGRAQARRVGAGRRLGDGHRLQAQLPARDLRQVRQLLRQSESGPAVSLRNESGEPARLGQRIDESPGVGACLIDAAKVRGRELRAQPADPVAQVLEAIVLLLHRGSPATVDVGGSRHPRHDEASRAGCQPGFVPLSKQPPSYPLRLVSRCDWPRLTRIKDDGRRCLRAANDAAIRPRMVPVVNIGVRSCSIR